MPRRPTPQELETLAATITRQQHTLQKQLATVKSHMLRAVDDIRAAKEELREAQARLEEIEAYLEDVEDEVDELRAIHGDYHEAVDRKQDEFDELLEEREDELGLIEQLRRVHALRASVVVHLRRMHVHLTRELARARRREQLLAVIALRSGLVKLAPRKP